MSPEWRRSRRCTVLQWKAPKAAGNSSKRISRKRASKKALYRALVGRLQQNPGLRPQDVFINLVEVAKENWSFGNGEAQYA
jgi:hypothetical protein